jgi:hypothetical protein
VRGMPVQFDANEDGRTTSPKIALDWDMLSSSN